MRTPQDNCRTYTVGKDGELIYTIAANRVRVIDGGALAFYRKGGGGEEPRVIFALAAGQWTSVLEADLDVRKESEITMELF